MMSLQYHVHCMPAETCTVMYICRFYALATHPEGRWRHYVFVLSMHLCVHVYVCACLAEVSSDPLAVDF